MGIFFSGSELIDVAVGIERNGAVFYDSLANSTKDSAIRGIYKDLADREREHIEIFQDMRGSAGDYQPQETYTEEYESYLKALIDSNVFKDTNTATEMAAKVNSDLEAIQIGLGAEKDSILFYIEMRDMIRRSERDVVSKVIEEEKSHVRQLMDLRKSLTK
ncbi:MAG: ferritin family protein [Dehalococcoidia bacterium]